MILQILGFACLAHLAADLISYLSPELPQKPWQCNMCMGWWLSFIPFIWQFGLIGILYAAITGIVSELIYRIINRL